MILEALSPAHYPTRQAACASTPRPQVRTTFLRQPQATAVSRGAAAARLGRATVLLVDDEPANLLLLRRILEREGCGSVLAATSASEALRLYREQRPDLMLLDLHMPGLDGLAVLEQLQEQRPERARYPVLVLTDDASSEAREAALLHGANEFVARPFHPTEVLLRVNNLLETCFLHRELREQNRVLERTVAARTAALELDIERRERVERELRTCESRFRHLVENASDLIVQTGPDGGIQYANEAALRATGFTAAELEGMPFLSLVPVAARRQVRRFYVRQLRRRQPSSYCELPILTRDGREMWLGQNVRLTLDASRVVAAQIIARDVTERRHAETLENEVLSVASHEMRTPLTSIPAAPGLLESGLMENQPERARQTPRIATRSCERLARILNDSLDLERLSSGTVRVECRPYDVGEIMAQAAEPVRSAAEAAGVMLVVTPVQAEARMDAGRMCQVLVNLLSNAVKFSPPGGTVWLGAVVQEEYVTFSVRDRGRGIPADKRAAVFQRVMQVDASDARDKGGSGLGLAISRTIVDQHRGQIWIDPAEQVGSTFHVRLPR